MDWSIVLWVSQLICSQYYSLFPVLLDGLPIGLSSLLTLRTISTGRGKTILDILRDNLLRFPRDRSINLRLRLWHLRRIKEERLHRALKNKENDLNLMDSNIMYYIIKQWSLYFWFFSNTLNLEFVCYYFRLFLFFLFLLTLLFSWGIFIFAVYLFNADDSS